MEYYDYYFTVVVAVKLEHEQEFMNKLSNADRKFLEENPSGIVERDDAVSNLPNQTFEENGYKIFVRRLEDNATFFNNIYDLAIDYFNDKYGDDCVLAAQIYLQAQHINESKFIGSLFDFGCLFSAEIIYTITNNYGFHEYNQVVYSSLEENSSKTDRFATLVLTLESNVMDYFHKILPAELSEYLERMSFFHDVYEDENGFEDPQEIYILPNLPFKNGVDYDNADEGVIGQKFMKFFEDNTDALLDRGEFSGFLIPQYGIIQPNKCITAYGNLEFSTPASIVYDFCDYLGLDEDDVSIYIGDIGYYAKSPTYLSLLREIYFPQDINKDKPIAQDKNIEKSDINPRSLQAGFREYLIAHGYKEYTDKGAPSTVHDYMKRIDFIAREENTDWAGVAANVDTLVREYDKDGVKAELGAKGHNSVINALKAFQRFIKGDHQEKETPEVKEARSESSAKTPAELLVDPAEAITDDYIQCCICGEKRQNITHSHLAKHGLTMDEYKKLCGYDPDQPLKALKRMNESR